MFKEIRESIDLMEGITRYTNLEWVAVGSYNFELEDKTCPFPDCGHKDCFRVKKDDEDYFYKCFSCDAHGRDLTSFYSELKKVDAFTAARQICKDYGIKAELTMSTTQKIFELAANFYHQGLLECQEKFVLGGVEYTALSYQTDKRGHSTEVLSKEMVGFVVPGLLTYLQVLDFTDQELLESGLFSKDLKTNKLKPFFFSNHVYIYPFFVKGRVSHFTTKDPQKNVKPFQLKNEFRLNGCVFLGQDCVSKSDTVFLVEGENDRLTLLPRLKVGEGVIAANGQISRVQVDWLQDNMEGKELVTIFDSDDAGAKYRDKFWNAKFEKLSQLAVPEGFKDIDEYFQNNPSKGFDDLIRLENPNMKGIDRSMIDDTFDIFEHKGCYYKLTKNAEGGDVPTRISDFIMDLKNVFIKKNKRIREMIFIREDGMKLHAPHIDSSVKVSLKSFREFVADAIDGSFYGSEQDLMKCWDFSYKKGLERPVTVPEFVGHINEDTGWLFKDALIRRDGSVIWPDEEGIMWTNGNSNGYKPISNRDESSDTESDRHELRITRGDSTPEARRELLGGFLVNLGRNLGSMEAALTMTAWAQSCAYSKKIYHGHGFFPFLFLWGKHGQGKTTLMRWLLSLYGMQEIGYHTLPNLGTGVGFTRQLSFYSSLPMVLDEVRADQTAKQFYGNFRSWYNRQGRTLGTKSNSTSVVTQEVRACLVLGGQDVLTDAATRSRCIELQIPTQGREKSESYAWMEPRTDDFRWIGFEWITDACEVRGEDLMRRLRDQELAITSHVKCDSRIAKHWAIISLFGQELNEEYGLGVDVVKYVREACAKTVEDQHEEDVLMRFFTTVEGMQVEEHGVINSEHIRVDGNDLIIWMAELVRLAKQRGSSVMNEGERFSKNAILHMLEEELYCKEVGRRYMGPDRAQRRVYVLDGNLLPPTLQNIRDVARTW